jgi:hypothetical protein
VPHQHIGVDTSTLRVESISFRFGQGAGKLNGAQRGAALLSFLIHLTVHFHLTVRAPTSRNGKGTGEAQDEARLTTAAEDGAACGALSSVSDLAATVEALREAGAHFRNNIVTGIGGKQILLEDPSGNPIELFEPTLPEARLSTS